MLSQADVVRLLAKSEHDIPQVVAFSILHAYVYSKSRRGNLPSETLSKLLSMQRKLQTQLGHSIPSSSPIGAALEAMKGQLMAVNRKWFSLGPKAFGPLGALGATGGHADAQWAWERATDGKVKDFPKGDGGGAMGWMPGGELDAGRVIEADWDPLATTRGPNGNGAVGRDDDAATVDTLSAPPEYDGPPAPDGDVVQALEDRQREDANGLPPLVGRDSVDTQRLDLARTRSGSVGTGPANGSTSAAATASEGLPPTVRKGSITEGAAHLARLRQLKEDREREAASSSSSPTD